MDETMKTEETTKATGTASKLENVLKGGLEEAQKRFQGLEAEAQKRFQGLEAEAQKRIKGLETEAGKVVQGLKTRGQESRKELETLLGKLDKLEPKELLAHPRVKELSRKVDQAGTELRKRFGGLKSGVVESVGVASQSQVKQIHREISKLSKKLDEVVGSASAAVANGAAHVTGKKNAAKSSAPRV